MAAVTGAVIAVGSATMSFVQASKEKKAADKANEEAARLMADARKKAEVNQFEELSIPTEAYEAEFEANLAADQQAIESLQEGDARALAAGVGRIGAQQAEEAQETRIEMGQDLYNLDMTKAEARENVKQQLIGLDVGQAADESAKAAEAADRSAAAMQQGIQSVGSAVGSVGDAGDAYSGNKRRTNRADKLDAKNIGEDNVERYNRRADRSARLRARNK